MFKQGTFLFILLAVVAAFAAWEYILKPAFGGLISKVASPVVSAIPKIG